MKGQIHQLCKAAFLLAMLWGAFAGHAQTIPLQLPDGYGTLRLGVVCGEESRWLDKCEITKDGTRYIIRSELWRDGSVELTLCPLTDAEGFIVKATRNNLPADARLCWAFGACNDKASQRPPLCEINPQACKDNVFSTEGNAFTVYHGEVMRLRITQGVMPLGSEMRLADAHKQESPLTLYNSSKKTDAPVLSALCPWQEGQPLYLCVHKPGRNADYAHFMLPELFDKLYKD